MNKDHFLTHLRAIKILKENNTLSVHWKTFREKFPNECITLMELTSFLPSDFPINLRWLILINDINEVGKCKVCGELTTFDAFNKRFNLFCRNKNGKSCAMQDRDIRDKKDDTTLTRYGVKNIANIQATTNKRKQTMLSRYGVDSACKMEGNKSLIKYTDQLKEKQREGCFEKYGVYNFNELKVPNHIRELCSNYNWMYNQYITLQKDKTDICSEFGISSYTLRKYLNQHNLTEEFKTQQLNKQLSEYLTQFTDTKHLRDKNWLTALFTNYYISRQQLADHFNVSRSYIDKLCNDFNILDVSKSNHESSFETSFCSFLTNHNIEFEKNNKTIIAPYELDCYIPTLRLAIELCGIRWHSELKGKDKHYHKRKWQMCQDNGIQLIQIWDNEWKNSADIVKSKILNACKKASSIYARKTKLIQLTTEQERTFFSKSHLQGHLNSTICYGLEFNNTIVAAMSFIKSRYNKQFQWELLRFANLPSTHVVGGASKILKYFEHAHHPSSLISYCDMRWGTGNMYLKTGFTLSHISNPSYYYFNINAPLKLYHRSAYQKHKLKEKLLSFDPMKTEWDNMKDNNFDRIWDCGNKVFIKHYVELDTSSTNILAVPEE